MQTWGAYLSPPPRHAAAAGAEVRIPVRAEAAFPTGDHPGVMGVLGVVLPVVLFAMILRIITKIAQRGILALARANNDVVRYSFGSAPYRECFSKQTLFSLYFLFSASAVSSLSSVGHCRFYVCPNGFNELIFIVASLRSICTIKSLDCSPDSACCTP